MPCLACATAGVILREANGTLSVPVTVDSQGKLGILPHCPRCHKGGPFTEPTKS